MIPVPVKLFKLIINELGTLLESVAAGAEHEDGDSDDVSHPLGVTAWHESKSSVNRTIIILEQA